MDVTRRVLIERPFRSAVYPGGGRRRTEHRIQKVYFIMKYSIPKLLENDGFLCSCGKRHYSRLSDFVTGSGILAGTLPDMLRKYAVTHPFVFCDRDTYAAGGETVIRILAARNIPYTLHVIRRKHPSPDERIVGEAVMHCGKECDGVIAIGGGVINDTCKILASARHIPDIYVSTAPSMDGYASATSSMERDNLKISLDSLCPDAVLCDADILSTAPAHMVCSGIGDMTAKITSLAEWKMASYIVGDYYCPTVADMVDDALHTCLREGEGAVRGDHDALCRLAEGLVLSGVAMNYAGISRPASGMEHYISHILDMRSLAFGTPADLHGIQCGIGTLYTLRGYEILFDRLGGKAPDTEKALRHAASFDRERWNARLREVVGPGAEAMIANEDAYGFYKPENHYTRLQNITAHWDEITAALRAMPSSEEIGAFFRKIGHPTTAAEIGVAAADMENAFCMAKDIRPKYILGHLLWDLGMTDEVVAEMEF